MLMFPSLIVFYIYLTDFMIQTNPFHVKGSEYLQSLH